MIGMHHYPIEQVYGVTDKVHHKRDYLLKVANMSHSFAIQIFKVFKLIKKWLLRVG